MINAYIVISIKTQHFTVLKHTNRIQGIRGQKRNINFIKFVTSESIYCKHILKLN